MNLEKEKSKVGKKSVVGFFTDCFSHAWYLWIPDISIWNSIVASFEYNTIWTWIFCASSCDDRGLWCVRACALSSATVNCQTDKNKEKCSTDSVNNNRFLSSIKIHATYYFKIIFANYECAFYKFLVHLSDQAP